MDTFGENITVEVIKGIPRIAINSSIPEEMTGAQLAEHIIDQLRKKAPSIILKDAYVPVSEE